MGANFMAYLPADSRELFLPLIEGIFEIPPWHTLMQNLLVRTQAQRGLLMLKIANTMQTQEPNILHFAARQPAVNRPIDAARLSGLGLLPSEQLRPERVYGLDEMLDFSDPAQTARQREALKELGIPYGRWLRVSAGAADAWVILAREREDFSSAAGAALFTIAPLLATALQARVKLAEQQLQAQMAQSTLTKLGIGQLALDRDGRIMVADAQAEAMLPIAEDLNTRPGRHLRFAPEVLRRIEEACAAFAQGKSNAPVVVPLGGQDQLFMLLHPADSILSAPGLSPAVIATVRASRNPEPQRANTVIKAIHGLSEREAALSACLMRGDNIVQAGANLHLTPETARNYSKRIYSKTGSKGHADLVRRLQEGLAPLA